MMKASRMVPLLRWLLLAAVVSLPAAYVARTWGWETPLKLVRRGTSGWLVLLLILNVLASFMVGFWLARGRERRHPARQFTDGNTYD